MGITEPLVKHNLTSVIRGEAQHHRIRPLIAGATLITYRTEREKGDIATKKAAHEGKTGKSAVHKEFEIFPVLLLNILWILVWRTVTKCDTFLQRNG